jgi:hypothetical protein
MEKKERKKMRNFFPLRIRDVLEFRWVLSNFAVSFAVFG